MKTPLQELFQLNWFKLESDCCKAPMKNTDIHISRFYTQMDIYECQSCKKEYIAL